MESVTYTKIAELILKHLIGKTTDKERLELDKIVTSSDEYKKLYEDLTNHNYLGKEIVRMGNWDIEASWKKIASAIFPPK